MDYLNESIRQIDEQEAIKNVKVNSLDEEMDESILMVDTRSTSQKDKRNTKIILIGIKNEEEEDDDKYVPYFTNNIF